MKQNTDVINVTNSSWTQEVINSEVPVLVDFWAPWCGPCRMMGPVIDEVSRENKFNIKFAKVNVDENQPIAMQYNIQSIPTVAIFGNGKIIRMAMGSQSKASFEKFISVTLEDG